MSFAARLAAVLLAFVVQACSTQDVVLATVVDDSGAPAEAEAEAQAESDAAVACSQPRDCPAGTYCDLPGCDVASGTCQPLPSACAADGGGGDSGDVDFRAVCGCDGVTYFDDCLRMTAGVGTFASGPCSFAQSALSCGGPSQVPCPGGAVCAILLGSGPCPDQPEGSCWVLPPQCPAPAADGGHDGGRFDAWDSCEANGPQCQDLCDALRAGGAHRRSDRCP